MTHNDLKRTITQALDEMKKEQGDTFDLKEINLAELERRTGISRAKLRRLKRQGFVFKEHGRKGLKASHSGGSLGFCRVQGDKVGERVRAVCE